MRLSDSIVAFPDLRPDATEERQSFTAAVDVPQTPSISRACLLLLRVPLYVARSMRSPTVVNTVLALLCSLVVACGDVTGNSGGETCSAPSTECGGVCTSTVTDNANCGTCGNACPAGQACSDGVCSVTCASPLTTCSGSSAEDAYCADIESDRSNCGACGNACDPGLQCMDNLCIDSSSYISPAGFAASKTAFSDIDYTISTQIPATIHYTTDGTSPSPGVGTTTSAPSPVTLATVPGATPGTVIRWFADYGGSSGAEPFLHSFTVNTVAPGNDLGVLVNLVKFTGVDGPVIRVAPGATVTGSVRAQYWRSNASGYCPGCLVQWVLGVDGVGQVACVASVSTVYPGQTSTPTFTFTAPAQPGRYVMRTQLQLQTSCQSAGYSGGEDVGVVIVEN